MVPSALQSPFTELAAAFTVLLHFIIIENVSLNSKMASEGQERQKICFATIGATAAFDALIEAVLSLTVLQALSKAGYAKILVQYGKDGKALYERLVSTYAESQELGLHFDGFDFDRDGLYEYMVSARESGGVVISHAGSGSILDALRVNAPLIVVPNSKLLDNHQDDLAEALSAQGYVVHGKLESAARDYPVLLCY